MTSIPAKVLTIDKQEDKHRIIVRIVLPKYRGSFNTLKFGENKPLMGSCRGSIGAYLLPGSGTERGRIVSSLDDSIARVIRVEPGELFQDPKKTPDRKGE